VEGELVTFEPKLEDLYENLTTLQQRFVDVLVETPDVIYAYGLAGGKAKRPHVRQRSAYEILVNPQVQKYLRKFRRDRMERTLITSDWVLNKIVQLIERCMQGQQVLNDDGEPTGEWKFDSAGAAKGLHLLMKHMGMFEKDNRQKTPQDREALYEKLRQRGFDPQEMKSLGPNGSNGN
jgi:phage terminase small subunit